MGADHPVQLEASFDQRGGGDRVQGISGLDCSMTGYDGKQAFLDAFQVSCLVSDEGHDLLFVLPAGCGDAGHVPDKVLTPSELDSEVAVDEAVLYQEVIDRALDLEAVGDYQTLDILERFDFVIKQPLVQGSSKKMWPTCSFPSPPTED